VHRGEIREFVAPNRGGHEQQGKRYGVIVQADALLPRSVVLVAPTSASARPMSFRPEVSLAKRKTRILIDQVGAVDVRKLGRRVGQLTVDELWAVDDALLTVFGLD